MEEIAYMFLGVGDDDDNDNDHKHAEEEEPSPPTPTMTPTIVPGGYGTSPSDGNVGYVSHPQIGMDAGMHADNRSHAGDSLRVPSPPQTPAPTTPKRRLGFRDLLSKANIQDQLLDKLFQQVIPIDSSYTEEDSELNYGDPSFGAAPNPDGTDASRAAYDADLDGQPPKKERPGFSVAIMSNNFRRFNARIGVVFRFQKKIERLLTWRRTSHTVAFLGTYTIVCLDPYILTLAPPAVLLLSVLIPGFIARHPGTSTTNTPTLVLPSEYYARGPPLAPPRTVKPVKELSRDFFRNMGDLQNSMEDFSVAHDQIVNTVVPATNFADEAFSSALFVVLCGASVLLSVAAHLLPYRLIFLVGGWGLICSQHPAVARLIRVWKRSLNESMAAAATEAAGASPSEKDAGGDGKTPEKPASKSHTDAAASLWNSWVASDIILDEAPETREVEIFELQHRSSPDAAEWDPWVFSPSPFDPLSQSRLNANASSPGTSAGGYSNGRPTGARFFEDVLPPHGWEWSEKKWALDLWSRDWVEERIITGVEVETEGERWVYDMLNEHDQQQQLAAAASSSSANYGYGDSDYYADNSTGLHPPPSSFRPQRRPLGPSWEEGEEGVGRRGEWRRRRWVRMVKRRKITAVA